MVRHRLLIAGLLLSLCSGCSGVSAAQVAQTVGAITGSILAPGVGAPLGALVGTLAGLVVQGQVDQATAKRERVELGDQLATGSPPALVSEPVMLPQGEPTRVWVDEMLHGGRLIAGHFDVRVIP